MGELSCLRASWLHARTPDPADGRFEREADGSLGTVHEGAADLIGVFVPEPSFEDRLTGLLRAQRHLHERGVTAWQDAIVGAYLGSQDPLPVYLEAARSGQLTARVRGALWWERERGAEQIAELSARREARPGGPVHRRHRQDHAGRGGREFSAGMLEPYLDCAAARPADAACPTWTPMS